MAQELFQWDKQYELKVGAMDDEHKKLIALMNSLHKKYESKAPFFEQLAAFKELANFTVKHFADVEAFMAAIKFPSLEIHKIIHKQLLEKIFHFSAEIEKSKSISPDIFGFLKTWLTAHILGVDTQYAEHSRKKAS